MADPLVIVGASYAGLQIGISARAAGFSEPILLLGEEPEPPYQRPPLSKGFVNGTVAESALPLRPPQFLEAQRIALRVNTRVTAIDRTARRVETAGGERIAYGALALAVGCRARLLPAPGAELDGVLYLRTLADARAIRDRIGDAQAALVVGGGFIGLEIAASLKQLGREVTVIESLDRLLARAVPPRLSEFFAQAHARRGVRIRTNTTVARLDGEGGRVRSATLSDGSTVAADLVVVGIGVHPNSEIAQSAGLACDNGIVVDRFARTSDPAIVAAGDCTQHPNRFFGGPVRLESVQNALDQGKTAGGTLAGEQKPYDAVPWFWSDQFELKLQMVGSSGGHDLAVVRGAIEEERFSLFYFRAGALIGIDSVNRAADHMAGRNLIPGGVALTPDQAADPAFDLAALVKAARGR